MQGYRADASGLLRAGEELNQAMGGFGRAAGGALKGYMDQKNQAEAEQAKQVELQTAMQSGNPMLINQAALKYPDASQNLRSGFEFMDQNTEKNFSDTNFKILSDPENAEIYLTDRINYLQGVGADTSQTVNRLSMLKNNPEQFMQATEGITAAAFPNQYSEWRQGMQGEMGGSGGTANIQDIEYYRKLKKEDPELAALFAKQIGIGDKKTPSIKPTVAMQNLDKWASMPDGPEKDAFARMTGVNPKASFKDLKEGEKAEKEKELKATATQDAIANIDAILASKDLDRAVGLMSALPTMPGGRAADLEAKIEQFKNQLTLENLDKMSGVLTDRDIQVLSSAASGLEMNMSPEAFKAQLRKIRAVLSRGAGGSKPAAETESQQPTQQKPKAVNWGDL